MGNRRYILTQDNDSHWYVVPKDKEQAFYDWCEAMNDYWDGTDNSHKVEPEMDEEFVEVGGGIFGKKYAPGLVSFENPVIS